MSGAPLPADLQDRIFEFLEELRHRGFRIGVREHVAARKLFVALREEEQLSDFAAVGAWLAPIVCASPADQATFDERWAEWVKRQEPKREREERAVQAPDAELTRRWRRRAAWAAAATVALIGGLIVLRAVWLERQSPLQGVDVPVERAATPARPPSSDASETPESATPTAPTPAVAWTRRFDAAVLPGHKGSVWSVAFSSDGKVVASGGTDGAIRLWNVDERTPRGRPLLGHAGAVRCVSFSPDRTVLASSGRDDTIRLWTVNEGTPRGRPWPAMHGDVLCIAFSPDGQAVVSGGADGAIRSWSVNDGVERGPRLQYHSETECIAFAPNGVLLAAGYRGGAVRVWNHAQGTLLKEWRADDDVTAVAFSSDGTLVASATQWGSIQQWPLVDNDAARPLAKAYDGSVAGVAFSSDGTLAVLCGDDSTTRLWNVLHASARGEPLDMYQHGGMSVALSPDARTVAFGAIDGTIGLFSVDEFGLEKGSTTTRRSRRHDAIEIVVLGHEGAVGSAVFSSDGSRIVTASRDGSARIFDRQGTEIAALPDVLGPRPHAVLSSDGARMLVTTQNTARLLDLEGGVSATYSGHEQTVHTVVLSRDGERVLTASADGTARLFDVGGKDLTVFRGHTGSVNTAAFSPNADFVVTAGDDGTARIFDIDGKELAQLRGHEGPVNSAVYSPDGERILTAGDDRTARVFDLEGKELAVFRGHEGPVRSAVFSSDGERVLTASADGTAVVWDKETEKPLRVLRGHAGPVNSAVFDPDDRYVVTASNDETARVWDAGDASAISPALLAVLVGGALVLFAALRALFRRAALQRRATRPSDIVKQLPLAVAAPRAADALAVRRQSVQLRRAALVGTGDVDVERTVERTIDGGGFVQVVRRGRPQTPEYLALVERVAPRDHLARHFDERLERLRDEGIHVERMTYRGEPSAVFVPEGRGRYDSLADVHSRYSGHRVWTLGEARIAAGAVASDARWLEALADWPHRSFIVPQRADATPELGAALARIGVRLAALDDAATTLDEPGRKTSSERERAVPFPPSLAGDAERWMSPTAPEAHRIPSMLDEVRRHLGAELFRWFAACAVYPELHYELTLQLARIVLPERTIRDEDVVRLARLPWFRRGRMPDWLRRELLRALSRDDEQRVRDWFLRAFTQAARGADAKGRERDVLELPIAQEAKDAVREEFRGAVARARKEDSADPGARDAVFLSWMDDRLAVAIPRRAVRELRARWNGSASSTAPTLRPWWRALIGALVAGFLLTCWRAYLGGHAEIFGIVALTPYAVLTAAARRFQAGGAHAASTAGKLRPVIVRALLFCELEALFMGGYMIPRAIFPRAFPETPDDAFSGFVGAMTVLAWLTFELLAFRARRSGGSTRFERVADGLMLDRVFEWLGRDHSRGEKPADVPSRPWLQVAVTQVAVGGIVLATWAIEREGPPHEWVWASAGLLLAVVIGSSALSSPKIGSRYGWLVAAAEVFCAWSTVLIASASMSREVHGTNGVLVAAVLAAAAALIVAALAALRRRRHPLFAALSPLLAVCDSLALGRGVDALVSRLRAPRAHKAPEAAA